jgi:hypothetical protein
MASARVMLLGMTTPSPGSIFQEFSNSVVFILFNISSNLEAFHVLATPHLYFQNWLFPEPQSLASICNFQLCM